METKSITTAEKNAEILKRGYVAFNSGDTKTLSEIFHPNSTWHTPGRSPVSGIFKGRDATFVRFGRYAGETALHKRQQVVIV